MLEWGSGKNMKKEEKREECRKKKVKGRMKKKEG